MPTRSTHAADQHAIRCSLSTSGHASESADPTDATAAVQSIKPGLMLLVDAAIIARPTHQADQHAVTQVSTRTSVPARLTHTADRCRPFFKQVID